MTTISPPQSSQMAHRNESLASVGEARMSLESIHICLLPPLTRVARKIPEPTVAGANRPLWLSTHAPSALPSFHIDKLMRNIQCTDRINVCTTEDAIVADGFLSSLQIIIILSVTEGFSCPISLDIVSQEGRKMSTTTY